MGGGDGQLNLSKGKSSGNVLVVFYRQLHIGRKDASFGLKYPIVLISMKILNYEEMFMEPPIYIKYVALTIVIFTYMLAIELFYPTQLCSFHGCFFEYLPIFLHLQVCGISLTRFKEFRKFWPCSFVDPLVKVTDDFWKIRGLIDGLNKLRRKIALGKEKTVDESISAIQFRTTPKGCLMRYFYTFRNPEPLGTEMKNVACSRLRKMLHLDIQNGKEDMKMSKFQNVLGGTTACMKRLAISNKGCGQLTSNNNYFSYSWLSSVKTDEGGGVCSSQLLRAG